MGKTGTLVLLIALGGCATAERVVVLDDRSKVIRTISDADVPGIGQPRLEPVTYPGSSVPTTSSNVTAVPKPVAAPARLPETVTQATPLTPPAEEPPLPGIVISRSAAARSVSITTPKLPPAVTALPKEHVTQCQFAATEPVEKEVATATTGQGVRLVNSKRISLNFEVKDVGVSGVSGIDLWYTQDGRTWRKYDGPPQSRPPFIAEMKGEGLYGFTLLARNGVGLGKRPPQPGDAPQVWTEVDLTKPTVQMLGIEVVANSEVPTLNILWKAGDKNLGPKPITLSYAEQAAGPWIPLAIEVENTGKYAWKLPPGMPPRFLVRVEATDLVKNIGSAQTPNPVLLDLAEPTVSIVSVVPASHGGVTPPGVWTPDGRNLAPASGQK